MRRVYLDRSYRNAVLATNPVSYWRLGEASGTVAGDEMGANNGTYVGSPTLGVAGLLSGDPNTAVTFVRANSQYLTIAGGPYAGDMTLSAWANPLAGPNNNLFNSPPGSLTLRYDLGDRIRAGICDTEGFATNGTTYTGLRFLTETWVASTKAYAIYVDGVLNISGTAVNAISQRPNAIGYLDPTWFFNGTIDEPAIWNRALTADEIARLYAVGRGF